MKKYQLVIGLLFIGSFAFAQSSDVSQKKMKFLIHITTGPENPTRAALGFLVARTAIEADHEVNIFLAGDAVQLIREEVLDNLIGLGTGKIREHYEIIIKKGGRFYLSGMSSKSRGVAASAIKGKPAELALPEVLLRLSIESDRMFVY
jgi:predicted peroxiredoxin